MSDIGFMNLYACMNGEKFMAKCVDYLNECFYGFRKKGNKLVRYR